jgi:co-chaperonin GroES (HSP10)
MKLLFDRLLAEPIPEETKSSIIIPLTVKKKENRARVVEASENLSEYIGETILHLQGIPIEVDGKQLVILKKNDVLAIV